MSIKVLKTNQLITQEVYNLELTLTKEQFDVLQKIANERWSIGLLMTDPAESKLARNLMDIIHNGIEEMYRKDIEIKEG